LEAYAPGVGRGKEEKIAVRKERTTTRVRIRLEPGEGKAGPAVVAGVAVTLASGGSGVLVTGVIGGSEAARAGIQAGDLILRIDGVAPEDERDALQRLRGPERQDVLLGLQRGQKTLELRVARERIRQ
jgi:C-terminal processing protease CtpA/Prc